MSPRPDVSSQRRRQIMEGAVEVFSQRGFAGASVDDIAAESGLSKGALYWYFKSKDQIIAAIFDQFFDEDLRGLRTLVQADGSTRERVLSYARHLSGDITRMSHLMPVAIEFFAEGTRQGNVRRSLRRYYAAYHELLAELLAQGVRRGEFPSMKVDQVAVSMLALIEGLIWLWVLNPEMVDLEQMADTSLGLLLDGLLSPS